MSQAIEEKRALLDRERGVTHEGGKELVREVVSSHIYTKPPTSPIGVTSTAATSTSSSYLDELDESQAERVNQLIQSISEVGIKKAIEQAKQSDPFLLDAFHDALVDKLYDELKSRGVVK